MKRIIWIVLVIVALIAVAVTKSIVNFAAEESLQDDFKNAAAQYIDYSYADSEETTPYISGKVVTIDVKKRSADYWTYPKLPPDMRANSPSEVGTIALIEWEKKPIGYYEDKTTKEKAGDAFQAIGNLTLIDWKRKLIIDRKTFVGDKPVQAKTDDNDYMGWWPMFDVVDYLKSLPTRTSP